MGLEHRTGSQTNLGSNLTCSWPSGSASTSLSFLICGKGVIPGVPPQGHRGARGFRLGLLDSVLGRDWVLVAPVGARPALRRQLIATSPRNVLTSEDPSGVLRVPDSCFPPLSLPNPGCLLAFPSRSDSFRFFSFVLLSSPSPSLWSGAHTSEPTAGVGMRSRENRTRVSGKRLAPRGQVRPPPPPMARDFGLVPSLPSSLTPNSRGQQPLFVLLV